MMFTRTLTTFKATAIEVKKDVSTMTATMQPIASVTFVGTSPTKTDARKAFQEQGYTIPKGTDITIEEVKKVVYGCTLEEFLEIATPIEQDAE